MTVLLKSAGLGLLFAVIAYFLTGRYKKEKSNRIYHAEYTITATTLEGKLSLGEAIKVLKKRLESGEYEYRMMITEPDTILVSVKNVRDTGLMREILTANNRVEFREVYRIAEVEDMVNRMIELIGPSNSPAGNETTSVQSSRDSMSKSVSDLLDSMEAYQEKKTKNKRAEELIRFSSPYQLTEPNMIYYPAEIGYVDVKDTTRMRLVLDHAEIKKITPVDLFIRYGIPEKGNAANKNQIPLYFLKRNGIQDKAEIENEDIRAATQDFDQYGKVEIRMDFTAGGARKWAYMTRKNIGRAIAMVINGKVVSAPTVKAEILDGVSSISGDFTPGEAELISMQLAGYVIPANLKIISATLTVAKSRGHMSPRVLAALGTFILFTGLALFVFKTLKTT